MLDKLHEARLRRGRRVWNLAAATHYGLLDRLTGPALRRKALEHLNLYPLTR